MPVSARYSAGTTLATATRVTALRFTPFKRSMPSIEAARSSPVCWRSVAERHVCTSVPAAAPSVSKSPNLILVLPTSIASSTSAFGSQRRDTIENRRRDRALRSARHLLAAVASPQNGHRIFAGAERAVGAADAVGDHAIKPFAFEFRARVRLDIIRFGGEPHHETAFGSVRGDVGHDVGIAREGHGQFGRFFFHLVRSDKLGPKVRHRGGADEDLRTR